MDLHPTWEDAAEAASAPPALDELRRHLARIVDVSVVPRLDAAQRDAVDRLATLAAAGNTAAVDGCVDALLHAGWSGAEVCHLYLTLAARRLGEWWLEDRTGFCEVTMGVMALRAQLLRLAPLLPAPRASAGHRALAIACAPGEQHRFGAAMLAETFRAAGWHVAEGEAEELPALARALSLPVVALSAGTREAALALAPVLARLRRLAPAPFVMVGGPAFLHDPDLTQHLGADATAADAPTALARAEQLVGLLMEGP